MPIEPVPLELRAVNKTYPNGARAVNEISLTVEPGKVFGLIGPNGAGKSTLLRVAGGLLHPDKGSVICGGIDVTGSPARAARFVGLMPDPLGVYTDITAGEYLEFFARLFKIPAAQMRSRLDHAIEVLELGPWLSHEVESLSAGWQRRLALARLLLPNLPVLLLDEPAAGLDLLARKELLSVVRRLAGTGHTIVVSSHILSELEDLADTFGVLIAGRWREALPGKVFFARSDLETMAGGQTMRVRAESAESARSALSALGLAFTEEAGSFFVRTGVGLLPADLLKQLVDRGVRIEEFGREAAELGEVVLALMEKQQ